MLETLTRGFTSARGRLAGVRTLGEKNIQGALADVRRALLEADLDLQQVEDFLARVREQALGKEVATRARGKDGKTLRMDPAGHFTAICERELCALMEDGDAAPAGDAGLGSVMLIGLQGVGKTTLAAKLAHHLQQAGGRVLLAAADVQRPAAAEQLEALGASIGAQVLRGATGESPVDISVRAEKLRRSEGFDSVIYDTAGRTAIDETMLAELAAIDAAVHPESRLLVCDAMMGRDAVHTARRFAAHIPLDGLVMSKADSDARGGAILAMKAATGVPIRFLSTGEGVKQLEAFRPEGIASRILGMGDVVGLVKDFEGALDVEQAEQAEQDAERMLKGRFTMEDLLSQLRTLRKMGPLKELMARLPGGGALAEQADEGELGRVEALIQSMTRSERLRPELIDKSRAQRIAGGSGRSVKDVGGLLDRFRQMKRMMGKLGKMGGKGGLPALPGGPGGGAGFDPGGMGMEGLLGGFPGAGGLPGAGGRQGRRALAAQRKRANKKRKDAKKARRRGRRK